MNKITKELINDSSFDFFSSYLDINLRENRQIYELNVRTNIHDLIYQNLVEIESDIYF